MARKNNAKGIHARFPVKTAMVKNIIIIIIKKKHHHAILCRRERINEELEHAPSVLFSRRSARPNNSHTALEEYYNY
jgi:hypothetical protein